jgi:uncharacterized membrane protein YkoI
MPNRIITGAVVAVATVGAAGGVAFASGSGTTAAGSSRLDDGKQLLGQATITEQQAITAAQGAAKGGLNEIDLEQYAGRLVFNVDVGSAEAKVDAATGQVLAVTNNN